MESQAVAPALTMVQACPPNQLSYGYGYFPLNALLPSTVAFAQARYPKMRFGLGLTLMGNGFFGFDFGDEAPPVAWWYDEYDFKLGTAIGLPEQVAAPAQTANLPMNPGFESGLTGWELSVTNDGQAMARRHRIPRWRQRTGFRAYRDHLSRNRQLAHRSRTG